MASGVLPVHLMRPRFSATRAISPAPGQVRCAEGMCGRRCEGGPWCAGEHGWRPCRAGAWPLARVCKCTMAPGALLPAGAHTCAHEPFLLAQHLHRRLLGKNEGCTHQLRAWP